MSLSLRAEALSAIQSVARDIGGGPFQVTLFQSNRSVPWGAEAPTQFIVDAIDLGSKERSIASVPEFSYHQTLMVAGGEYQPRVGDKLTFKGRDCVVRDFETLAPVGVTILHKLYIGS